MNNVKVSSNNVVISIPTGTIKRDSENFSGARQHQFQFLLVRLKGHKDTANVLGVKISIPTGTIKSAYVAQLQGGRLPFQFLLVRLKDHFKNLKNHDYQISIPTGTIKRLKMQNSLRIE